ncbi:MAG: 16S rRNA (uracil(1498)-N(3))-methyltransferase [Aestuariivirga sp.]
MKTIPRLYSDQALGAHGEVPLTREQAHYLTVVLRLGDGDPVRVFNGRDGEWLAHLGQLSKRSASLRCETRLAHVNPPPDIDYLFAPLKHARLDYLVQKATELGARRLRPVITERTIAKSVNLERMRANVIEAAEQCNLVFLPEVAEPETLEKVLARWDKARALVYCDETADAADPIGTLRGIGLPAAVLVGPEGGFAPSEKNLLKSFAFVTAISMGPRIMRADTAAVAVMALVQAVLGDWHQQI